MPSRPAAKCWSKVAACSLNFRDLGIVRGTYRMPVRDNIVPLSDGAGEVVEVGAGVTRVKVGDRVAGCFLSTLVRRRTAPECAGERARRQHRRHAGGIRDVGGGRREGSGAPLSVEESATLPCAGVTAWHALVEHGKLVAGRTALLQGTGGVSTFGLQLPLRPSLSFKSAGERITPGARDGRVATRKGAELRCNPMLPLFSLVFDGTSKCTTREAGLRHDIVLFGRSK
jgi:Alcohol dehydrogenase GroES-like domain